MRAKACTKGLGGVPEGNRGILRGGEELGAWGGPSVGGRGGQEMVEQDGDSGLSSLGEVGDRSGGPWLVERET